MLDSGGTDHCLSTPIKVIVLALPELHDVRSIGEIGSTSCAEKSNNQGSEAIDDFGRHIGSDEIDTSRGP